MKKALETGVESIDPLLLEEANTLPKCMLSVGPNKTRFIDYILWNAVQAGFEEIVVVLNPKDTVTEAHIQNEKLLRNYKSTVTIRFIRQIVPADREKPWGTGDAVWQALA